MSNFDNISIGLIKYGTYNQFVDFINYNGDLDTVLNELKNYLDENIPLVYSREKIIGEYIKEIDSNVIYFIFNNLKDFCNLFKDKILVEYNEKLKYIKISYSKLRGNSKTNDLCIFKNLMIDPNFKELKDHNQIQSKHDFLSGYYIIYFASVLKTNLHKSKFKSSLTNSALKVYDIVSKSTYPIGRDEIVLYTMLSPRTVSYACKELVERNLIEKIIDHNYLGKSNKNNKYYRKES